jgi:hypothetical protein
VPRLPGITVAAKRDTDYASTELVQDFVFYTADLPLEAAADVAGVSTATLSRWRMMGARQLRADVKNRLLHFVAAKEEKPGVSVAA